MSAMSATKTSKTLKKSPDFTEQESVAIINAVTIRYRCINSSNHTSQANKRRRAAWDEVTNEVNACGGFGPTVESVQKRWKDMKFKVRNKPRLGRQTGGGPPEPPAPFEEPILAVLMGSSTIDGIVGEGLGDTYTYDGECLGDTCGDSQEGATPVGDEDNPDGDGDVIVISPDVPAGQDNITVDIPATKSSVDSAPSVCYDPYADYARLSGSGGSGGSNSQLGMGIWSVQGPNGAVESDRQVNNLYLSAGKLKLEPPPDYEAAARLEVEEPDKHEYETLPCDRDPTPRPTFDSDTYIRPVFKQP